MNKKIIFFYKGKCLEFGALSELNNSKIFDDIYVIKDEVFVKSITTRLFIYTVDSKLYLADSLKFIITNCKLTVSNDAVDFYEKFNFIYPPFTQYNNVYLMAPFLKFKLENKVLSFSNLDLQKKTSDNAVNELDIENEIKSDLGKLLNQENYSILVSGGIDSSVLLGWGSHNSVINSAYMCNMSSIPNESQVAQKQCDSKSINLTLFDLDMDLTHRAEQFINETGELISDPISIVFPELFERLNNQENSRLTYLIDGQGADSLFNGLPHNKLYSLWLATRMFSVFFKPFQMLPSFTDKSSSFKRMVYRAVKVIKSLAFDSFEDSLIFSLVVEQTNSKSKLEEYFKNEVTEKYQSLNNWDAVIRYIFLYRILPAREMQKYLLARKYNIKIVAPFIEQSIIARYINLDKKHTVKGGVYKYPMTKLANEYWPRFFKNSKTSPFQVNFTLKTHSLSKYSLESLK
jgi:asparagine synthetase B (glutamine-hydrolysing)